MGLLKKYDPQTGYTLEYWRISNIEVNYSTNKALVVIEGYLNQEARKNGLRPAIINRREISLEGININGNLREELYRAIKALRHNRDGKTVEDFFKDSTDVL